MKILVCGGRSFRDKAFLEDQLDLLDAMLHIRHVIHGGASGADNLAGQWATTRFKQVTVYPAMWSRYGVSAGPRRNLQMLHQGQPEHIVAFPGGRGTAHMVASARAAGVSIITINSREVACQAPVFL